MTQDAPTLTRRGLSDWVKDFFVVGTVIAGLAMSWANFATKADLSVIEGRIRESERKMARIEVIAEDTRDIKLLLIRNLINQKGTK